MLRRTHRRRYLELISTGLVGLIAGCTGGGGGGDSDGGMGDGSGAPAAEGSPGAGTGSADAAAPEDDDMGMTAGGSQDVGDFRNNIEEGYLPIPESLSYEGLFSEYYFETGGGSDPCESLFCAAYSPRVSPDPLGGQYERYFTIGLDSGMSLDEFERPKLNLVVVLDVSGSMDEYFDRYYYDAETGEQREVEGETDRDKIAVAKDALLTMTDQLRDGDRVGIVTFEDHATVEREFRAVESENGAAIRETIRDIRAHGGTNMEDGIQTGLDQLDRYRDADRTEYENRMIVITDAQPNIGDTSTGGLGHTLDQAAEDGQHTSFVGVGVDFNPELVDAITSMRGTNYFTVRSADQFRERMGEQFKFMVTPLVFDLTVELDEGNAELREVYGSSIDEQATDELLSVPTLFPSPQEEGRTKGGVILAEVDDAAGAVPQITAGWETRDGRHRSDTVSVSFPAANGKQYANTGVRKSVLLARYGCLLRNWMIYERDEDAVEEEGEIGVPPEDQLGRWEQTSERLRVSEPYEERIRQFQSHFRSEMNALGDEDLQKELDIMDQVLAADD